MDQDYVTCNEAEHDSSLTWNVKQISNFSLYKTLYVIDVQEKYGSRHFHQSFVMTLRKAFVENGTYLQHTVQIN